MGRQTGEERLQEIDGLGEQEGGETEQRVSNTTYEIEK